MGWQGLPVKDKIESPEGGVSPFFGMVWSYSFGSPGFPARSLLPDLTVCLWEVFQSEGGYARESVRSEYDGPMMPCHLIIE